jgi:hypothetical protein
MQDLNMKSSKVLAVVWAVLDQVRLAVVPLDLVRLAVLPLGLVLW